MKKSGRPTKHNCDYYSHDNGMRNDRKLKAVRAKYDLQGYAVYNMILETLTEANFLVIEWEDLEIEMMAGDFGIDSDLLVEMVEYFAKINLITLVNGYLFCPQLDERLRYVFDKRGQILEQLRSENDISVTETAISDTENTRSKVKGSKVKESENIFTGKTLAESVEDIFSFWNSQKIMVHRTHPKSGNSTLLNIVEKLLKTYTEDEIKQTITNYKKILDSDQHYFSYKWGLTDFLQRGFERFLDWNIADHNYRNKTNGKPKPMTEEERNDKRLQELIAKLPVEHESN